MTEEFVVRHIASRWKAGYERIVDLSSARFKPKATRAGGSEVTLSKGVRLAGRIRA
jgi:hypothetical protein